MTQLNETLYEYEITAKKSGTSFERVKVQSPESAFEVIRKFYHDDISIYESFFILMLDNSKHTIGYAKISQGGRTGTVVDIGLVAKFSIDCLAHSIIVAHNHPSGNLDASMADLMVTKKLKEGLRYLDISLEDHLILTPNGSFTSLRSKGILE
jgi:DNA repair protein RadC